MSNASVYVSKRVIHLSDYGSKLVCGLFVPDNIYRSRSAGRWVLPWEKVPTSARKCPQCHATKGESA